MDIFDPIIYTPHMQFTEDTKRLSSTYVTRRAVEIQGVTIPLPFKKGEVLHGLIPHGGHPGDVEIVSKRTVAENTDSPIRRLLLQAYAVCMVEGCGAVSIVTAVLSEMGEPRMYPDIPEDVGHDLISEAATL